MDTVSTAVRFYRNGVAISQGSEPLNGSGSRLSEGSIFRIGHSFDGKLDDVRFYNRVLSPEEVSDLYNATSGSGS